MNYDVIIKAFATWMRGIRSNMSVAGEKIRDKICVCREKTSNLAGRIWKHRESIGYYAVLLVVLAALATVAHEYRSGEFRLKKEEGIPDEGVAVQMQPDPTLAPRVSEPEFMIPVDGKIIGAFSDDSLEWSETLQLWQTHPAVDIEAAAGEAVYAAADGTVIEIYDDSLYGSTIVIDHGNGRVLRYASLNTVQMVETGQWVVQGEVIGSAGFCDAEADKGAHVHLEYFENGTAKDFFDLIDESERV